MYKKEIRERIFFLFLFLKTPRFCGERIPRINIFLLYAYILFKRNNKRHGAAEINNLSQGGNFFFASNFFFLLCCFTFPRLRL